MKDGAPTFREIVQSYFDLLREAEEWSDETASQVETEFWAEVQGGGHALDPECTESRRPMNAILFKTGQDRPDIDPPCITPHSLNGAMMWLRGSKIRFDEGEREALLEAIQVCAMFNVPIPDWARLEFFSCYRKYQTFLVKDLGDAFGVTRPKGAWHSAAKRKHDLFDRLYMGIQYRHEFYGESFGLGKNSLWPVVAKHFGISVSTARNYYYKEMTEDDKRHFAWKWDEWKQENPLPKTFGVKKKRRQNKD